ncbi:MAG: hypothetical protein KDC49_04575 [Saprospiraceae bacterium]|nr:hypothetical protein [Saprospiraceae bacterium]
MNVIGNLALVVASIIYLVLTNETLFKNPPRGGDAVVGYAWMLIMGGGLISLCLLITTGMLAWTGKLDWVNQLPQKRNFLILVGIVIIIVGYVFFLFGENPIDLPLIFRFIVKGLPVILPPMLIFAAAVLLNSEAGSAHPLTYKIPIFTGIGAGIIAFIFIISFKIQRDMAIAKDRVDFHDKIHNDHLNNIEKTDVSKDMVFLLVYTDSNHPSDVREKALAKIKSRADWQEELAARLGNDWAPEVFTFLASNDVPDKSLFIDAVKSGVYTQARLIREGIENCRDVYDCYQGRFFYEVDRVLRTVDKFKSSENSFVPEVQSMQRALQQSTNFKKPKFDALKLVENWISKNTK